MPLCAGSLSDILMHRLPEVGERRPVRVRWSPHWWSLCRQVEKPAKGRNQALFGAESVKLHRPPLTKVTNVKLACPHCQAILDLTGVRSAPSYRCPTCSGEFTVSENDSKPPVLPPPLTRPSTSSPHMGAGSKFCFACGNELHPLASICPKCGVAQQIQQQGPPPGSPFIPSYAPAGRREPAIAVLLSFIFPGLGQLYNGETEKGVITLIVDVILSVGTITICLPIIFLIPLWIWAMYDAYVVADFQNRSWRR